MFNIDFLSQPDLIIYVIFGAIGLVFLIYGIFVVIEMLRKK